MTTTPHLVLLGDSIFDNGVYVPDGTPVIEHVRRRLSSSWQVTLLAVDGNITIDVARQLTRLPQDATHLAISVGGNDALRASGILLRPVRNAEELMRELSAAQSEFQADYREMLRAVLALELPTMVCTIYDAIPGMQRWELAALCFFNDVILREAAVARLPIVDLRQICTEPSDYSKLSPIEPSARGGLKIGNALANVAERHDFSRRESVIYTA